MALRGTEYNSAREELLGMIRKQQNAEHNFWLLVQHQALDIKRRLLPALESAVKSGDAYMSEYAYLYDRK